MTIVEANDNNIFVITVCYNAFVVTVGKRELLLYLLGAFYMISYDLYSFHFIFSLIALVYVVFANKFVTIFILTVFGDSLK